MSAPTPSLSCAVKLASLAVHVEEMLSPHGVSVDERAVRSLLADPEVVQYMEELAKLGLLPVPR